MRESKNKKRYNGVKKTKNKDIRESKTKKRNKETLTLKNTVRLNIFISMTPDYRKQYIYIYTGCFRRKSKYFRR
jgi:hypothetical protein